ncbi:DUF3726 domain-containing protein [Pseudomonas protegens]|uniref:DUF3726 domain-containing protein n=1 Tax=Pseudomonas protegens TaxID=380021 RepID=UPI003FD84429
MHASLNEIESLCKKAARGAGLSWGLAEEAGKAARWLSAHGLDGPGVLATQLRQNDGCAYQQLAPDVSAEPWQVPGHALCPLIAGATLSDHSYLLRNNGRIELRQVAHPQLLLPFASATARQLGLWLELSWNGCCLKFSPRAKPGWYVRRTSAPPQPPRCAALAQILPAPSASHWRAAFRTWATAPSTTSITWPPAPTCRPPKPRACWAPGPA